MATVYTLSGPVDTDELGVVLPHEHLPLTGFVSEDDRIPAGFAEEIRPWVPPLLDELYEYGGRTLVELTPIACGRDIRFWQELAKDSKLHIVPCTGFYLQDRQPEWAKEQSADELAQRFVREIEVGIGDTRVRAGIIKIAADHLKGQDRKVFRAAAQASLQTGAAITTHSCHAVREHFDFLVSAGAAPERIYIGHADYCDEQYSEQRYVCENGGHLIFTTWGIQHLMDQDLLYSCVTTLIQEGYVKHLLMSIDFAIRVCNMMEIGWMNYNVPGRTYSYLFREVLPRLRELGVSKADIETMTVENGRKMLTIPNR